MVMPILICDYKTFKVIPELGVDDGNIDNADELDFDINTVDIDIGTVDPDIDSVINVDCGTDDDDGTVVGDTGKTHTDVMTLLYHKVIQWRDHCNKRHHGQEVTQGQRNWADSVGNCFPTCVNNYGGLGSCLAAPSLGRYITS